MIETTLDHDDESRRPEPPAGGLDADLDRRLRTIEDSCARTDRALRLVLDVIANLALNYKPLRRAIDAAMSKPE